jgi:catechol 2,3-dioxygenase-like lactoylglutathione lyase family enzyme
MTALTQGAQHVGLTVPDLETARRFFLDVLGFDQVAERPDYPAVFVSDGTTMVTLWRATDPARATPFDRKTVVGLHHLALRVAPERLDEVHARVANAEGAVVEFAPEPLGGGPTRHMMCAMPDGVRIEFIAPAA